MVTEDGLGAPSLMTRDDRYSSLAILLAFSDNKSAHVVRTLLHGVGCSNLLLVREASELYGRLVGSPIDLVIIDWSLQDRAGTEIVRKVRSMVSIPRDMPILQLVPKKHNDYYLQAINAGATEVVHKPFTAKMLISCIHSVIANPRPFVIAPGYVGPDRRRSDVEQTRPNGAEKRRTRPIALRTSADALSLPPGLAGILPPNYSLKQKMGISHSEVDVGIADSSVLPQSAFDAASMGELERQVADLLALNRVLVSRPDRVCHTVQAMKQSAAWIERRCTELGYQRIPDVARLLLDYCDKHLVLTNPASIMILEKHVLTLAAILRSGPESARGAIGESLVKELARQVATMSRTY